MNVKITQFSVTGGISKILIYGTPYIVGVVKGGPHEEYTEIFVEKAGKIAIPLKGRLEMEAIP